MKAVYVVEAIFMESAQALAVCATPHRATALIQVIKAHAQNAPTVDWNSEDDDLIMKQLARRNRYFKAGPGGEHAKDADDFRISRVRLWVD